MNTPRWVYRFARPVRFVADEVHRGLNRMTAAGRMPDFLIIGAQKAATTSLYRYLAAQSAVAAAMTKEVHFFDHQYHRGVGWYRSNFPARGPSAVRITGEASPYYLFHPAVAQRIRQTCPDVRLIAVLRDPVTRAISHHAHEVRRGFEDLPLQAAIEAEPARLADCQAELARGRSFAHEHYSYLARGRYAEQLRRWFEVFPRDQILILEMEQLLVDAQGVLGQAADFLGLQAFAGNLDAQHVGGYTRPETEVAEVMRDHFCDPNRDLVNLLGREFSWTRDQA